MTTSQADLFDVQDRVVLVTGASSGLGRRFADVLCRRGARVVVAARRADRLRALAEPHGDRMLAVPTDITDDDACRELVDRTLDRYGRIDALVNNAGMTVDGPPPALDEPPAAFRQVVDLNLTAMFVLTQLAAPSMVAQRRGSVVNVSSMFGLVAPQGGAAYAASKGAVVNLTRELAVQWAETGVRVNALAPGLFETELTASYFTDEKKRRFVERGCPLGRTGSDHELDGALVFLVSDASSYCTGTTLVVDGGWTAR